MKPESGPAIDYSQLPTQSNRSQRETLRYEELSIEFFQKNLRGNILDFKEKNLI